MNEINISDINKRLKEIESNLEALKNQKTEIENPTIKGLDKKYSELGQGDASKVIHLHNALIERLELLTSKVKSLEERL